jgi:hypothetical protein
MGRRIPEWVRPAPGWCGPVPGDQVGRLRTSRPLEVPRPVVTTVVGPAGALRATPLAVLKVPPM